MKNTIASCYICEQEILQGNTYNEHIILNSLGGKLKSKDLICLQCASSVDPGDAALSKMLNPIANLLDIKRDRGQPQPFKAKITKIKKDINISPGGKPAFTKPQIKESKNEINIQARSEKELRKILKGYKRKYPQLTDNKIKEILSQAERGESHVGQVEFCINLNDQESLRAICKMAISFYIDEGGDRNNISHLIPYIKGDEQDNNCVWYYYPSANNITDYLKSDKVVHILFIKGDTKKKILYGFIQLFSTFQFIILLNDNYTGDNFCRDLCKCYIFDVLEIKKIMTKDVDLNQINGKLNKLVDFIYVKQFLKYTSINNKKIVESVMQKCPEGEKMSDENFIELIDRVAKNFIETLFRM